MGLEEPEPQLMQAYQQYWGQTPWQEDHAYMHFAELSGYAAVNF